MTSAAAEALNRFQESFRPLLKRRRWEVVSGRLSNEIEGLFRLVHHLYGWRFDFAWILERLVGAAVAGYASRPRWLDDADARTEKQPELWVAFESGLAADPEDLITYLSDLGCSHIHFRSTPIAKSDTRHLIEAGFQVVADLDLDHVPQSHPWVEDAIRGDEVKASFFITFRDRSGPDAYGTQMRDLGGRIDGDAFTWHPELAEGRWVWTTHGPAQWDLDYRNPYLLASMVDRVFEVTNLGVTRICLRGLPLLWKRAGTTSINLLESHLVVQIIACLLRLVSPDAALVADHDARLFSPHLPPYERFIARDECRLGYEPRLTASIWEALRDSDPHVLGNHIITRYPDGCGRIASLGFPAAELSGLNRALETEDNLSADLEARRLLAAFAIQYVGADVPEIALGSETELPLPALSDPDSPADDLRRLGPQGLIWSGLCRLSHARQLSQVSGRSEAIRLLDVGDRRVLGLVRGRLTVLINTSPQEVSVNPPYLPVGSQFDLFSGDTWLHKRLGPFGFRFLVSS